MEYRQTYNLGLLASSTADAFGGCTGSTQNHDLPSLPALQRIKDSVARVSRYDTILLKPPDASRELKAAAVRRFALHRTVAIPSALCMCTPRERWSARGLMRRQFPGYDRGHPLRLFARFMRKEHMGCRSCPFQALSYLLDVLFKGWVAHGELARHSCLQSYVATRRAVACVQILMMGDDDARGQMQKTCWQLFHAHVGLATIGPRQWSSLPVGGPRAMLVDQQCN